MSRSKAIFVIGIMLFGFFYYPIRRFVDNDSLFIVVAIAYLLLLRYFASKTKNRSIGLSATKRRHL